MKHKLSKRLMKWIILLIIATPGYSQKEFFRSQQVFTEGQLEKFYSSITIHDSVILFNANDYQLYAYHKINGSLKWLYKNNYKTTMPVFVADNMIYAAAYKNEEQQVAIQISLVDGKLIKELPFGSLQTKPTVKNGILYGTAIYNYGCILGYDLQKDTVVWSRFIAHGYTRQPFYLQDKILANAEGDNWVALGYNGELPDTACAEKADIFVKNIPCIRKFKNLSHDGLEINESFLDKLFKGNNYGESDIITSKNFTYLIFEGNLSILSGKLQQTQPQQIQISDLTGLEQDNKALLLKADEDNIWILYSGNILQYNHKTKKVIQLTNLTAWEPKEVLLDDENVWLISGKDGLLYGLTL